MNRNWNPTRRNRNIGTSKSGHGQNNRLVIPDRFRDLKVFWERTEDYKVYTREVTGREIKFVVESNKRNYAHCCSVDDVTFLLSNVPPEDWEGINLFFFRQPKRKEEILSSVWGRLSYNVNIGPFEGPAIVLEATDLSKPLFWGKSLNPEYAIELERLKEDGHLVTLNRRGYIIEKSIDSVRCTQLYRTVLHEIGHWVHWQRLVVRPSNEGLDVEGLKDRYFNIPASEKEMFAHRYADDMREKLIKDKVIPFCRINTDRETV